MYNSDNTADLFYLRNKSCINIPYSVFKKAVYKNRVFGATKVLLKKYVEE